MSWSKYKYQVIQKDLKIYLFLVMTSGNIEIKSNQCLIAVTNWAVVFVRNKFYLIDFGPQINKKFFLLFDGELELILLLPFPKRRSNNFFFLKRNVFIKKQKLKTLLYLGEINSLVWRVIIESESYPPEPNSVLCGLQFGLSSSKKFGFIYFIVYRNIWLRT